MQSWLLTLKYRTAWRLNSFCFIICIAFDFWFPTLFILKSLKIILAGFSRITLLLEKIKEIDSMKMNRSTWKWQIFRSLRDLVCKFRLLAFIHREIPLNHVIFWIKVFLSNRSRKSNDDQLAFHLYNRILTLANNTFDTIATSLILRLDLFRIFLLLLLHDESNES